MDNLNYTERDSKFDFITRTEILNHIQYSVLGKMIQRFL